MIIVREMTLEESRLLSQIDRSEYIPKIYFQTDVGVVEQDHGQECGTWDETSLQKIQQRYEEELRAGGKAFGAFEGERLVGFGVLAHQFRGKEKDKLQLDLMYVTRSHRRMGIGRRIMEEIKKEASFRGARYLYISSTETESAVQFYRCSGSRLADEVDPELYALEPQDIHMILKLNNR